MKAFFFTLLAIIAPLLLWAADFRIEGNDFVFGKGIKGLPAHIKGEQGKISLVADFSAAKPGESIPVYLINLTAGSVKLEAQDRDVYLKLETQGEDGVWKRVQTHRYSGCGNSYMLKPTIRPGSFFELKGYQPATGKHQAVRYTLYDQSTALPSSNEGPGLVNEEEMEHAAFDSMALKGADFEKLRRIALGEVGVKGDPALFKRSRQEALYRLASGRFDKVKVLEALDQIEIKFPKDSDQIKKLRDSLAETGK
ncbi:MAG: hypothetical protein JWO08_668 [Verrucomicrobiaceae bacterium]|nr:hypothetical protein [Verrucomicrobiaceae bacterium]